MGIQCNEMKLNWMFCIVNELKSLWLFEGKGSRARRVSAFAEINSVGIHPVTILNAPLTPMKYMNYK